MWHIRVDDGGRQLARTSSFWGILKPSSAAVSAEKVRPVCAAMVVVER